MMFGTDAGVYPHGQNAAPVRQMVNGDDADPGHPAATINASEALGRPEVEPSLPGA